MPRGNPHQSMVPGLAVAPQAIGTSAVSGAAIVRPWEKGRFLSFIGIGGALVATDALTVKVQARRVGTTTWDDVQDDTGESDLAFTVADLSDGAALENGYVLGTIDLSRLTSGVGKNLPPVSDTQYEYDALRLNAVNANNSTPGIVGFAFVLTDLFTYPATDLDGDAIKEDLFFKQTPHTA